MLNGRKLLFLLAFSLLFISIVSALEVKKSEIVVTTEPYQNLSVTIINPDTNAELQNFTGRARKSGESRFAYYGVVNKISISASIINNDTKETLLNKKFGPYDLGTEIITINLTLSELDEEVTPQEEVGTNITNSSSAIANEIESEKSSILGFVIGEGNAKFSNLYYYVGAGALGLVILLIIFKRKVKTDKAPTEPNPDKTKTIKKVQSKTEVSLDLKNKPSITPVNSIDTEKRISELQK